MSCTPRKVDRLSYWLKGFDFNSFNYLIDGFKFGFDIGFRGSVTQHEVSNLLSARSKPEVVEGKVKKELEGNRFVGPFREKPFKLMQLSPLGLAEKKTPGTYRMIHHLSFPEGSSINDGIPEECCHVQYASIQDTIDIINSVGKNAFYAKTDISSAFGIINKKKSHLNGVIYTSMTKILKWVVVQVVSVKGTPNV